MKDNEMLMDISNTCQVFKGEDKKVFPHWYTAGVELRSRSEDRYIPTNNFRLRFYGCTNKTTLWLEMDFWIFLRVKQHILAHFRLDESNVLVECGSDMEFLPGVLEEQGFLRVKVSSSTCLELEIGELELKSNHRLIGNDILFFGEYEKVKQDLKELKTGGRSSLEIKTLKEKYKSIIVKPIPLYHRVLPDLHQLQIKISKRDISFLIGHHGKRIEFLKNTSGAIIKVIPISNKLNSVQTRNPRKITQEIILYGTIQQLHTALTLIDQHLNLSNIIRLMPCHHPECQRKRCKLYF